MGNQKVQRGDITHVEDTNKAMIFSREAILLRGTAIPVSEKGSEKDSYHGQTELGLICAPTVMLPSTTQFTFTKGSIIANLADIEDMVNAFNAIEVLENTEELTSHKQHYLKKKKASPLDGNDGIKVQEYSVQEEDIIKRQHTKLIEDDDEESDEQDTFIMERKNTMCALKMMANHENAMLENSKKKSLPYQKHSCNFTNSSKKSLTALTQNRKPSCLHYGKSIVQSNKFKTLYIPSHARTGNRLSLSDSSECSDHMLQNNFFQANELSNQNQMLSVDAVAHLKLKSMNLKSKNQ